MRLILLWQVGETGYFVGVQPLGWHWWYSFVVPASAGYSRPPEGGTANQYEEQPKGCTPTTKQGQVDYDIPQTKQGQVDYDIPHETNRWEGISGDAPVVWPDQSRDRLIMT